MGLVLKISMQRSRETPKCIHYKEGWPWALAREDKHSEKLFVVSMKNPEMIVH